MTTDKVETIEEAWDRLTTEYNTDVFMEPCMDELDYVIVQDPNGECHIFLQDDLIMDELEVETVITIKSGYVAWTSAPGYLDRTDFDPISEVSDLEQWFDRNFEIKGEITE